MAGRIEPSRRHGPFDPRFITATRNLETHELMTNHVPANSVGEASPAVSSWESEGGSTRPPAPLAPSSTSRDGRRERRVPA